MYYKSKVTGGFIQKFSNVDKRPNKVAKGFTKHHERNMSKGKENMKPDIGSLIVRGTTDVLAKKTSLGISKRILKEHPTDKGYFKEVLILSDAGKLKLKQLKYKHEKSKTNQVEGNSNCFSPYY